MAVTEALIAAKSKGMRQPGLFKIGETTWPKLEDEIVRIEANCVAEGVAYLLAIFYVFNMKYPSPLNGLYAFFEKLMGLSPSSTSTTVNDFYWKYFPEKE